MTRNRKWVPGRLAGGHTGRRLPWLICGLLLAQPALHAATGKTAVAPLEIEDAVIARSFQVQGVMATFSPDGAWVASTICDAARVTVDKDADPLEQDSALNKGCDVWLYSADGKTQRNLTGAQQGNWAPAWSPDGQRLAFISTRDGKPRLWEWDRARDALRRVSEAPLETALGIEAPLWTQGHGLLVKLALEKATGAAQGGQARATADAGQAQAPGSTVVVYQSPKKASQEVAFPRPPTDLALVDPDTGTVRRLAAARTFGTQWLSPDGQRLAYLDIGQLAAAGSTAGFSYDLKVLELGDGQVRKLVEGIEQSFAGPVSWSPDSRWLAYVARDPSVARAAGAITVGKSQGGDLWRISAGGGAPQRFAGARSNAFNSDFLPPVWDDTGRHLYLVGDNQVWQADVAAAQVRQLTSDRREMRTILARERGRLWSTDEGRSFWVAVRDPDTLRSGFCRVQIGAGAVSCPLEEARTQGGVFSAPVISPDGRQVLYLAEGAQDSPDLWVADAAFRSSRRFTTLNPQLTRYRFGTSRLLEFQSHDGRKLKASLLLPADYKPGKRYPTVVWVYASGLGAPNVNRFGLVGYPAYNMQMLSTRGYAVLWPDIPVNTGTPMQDLMKTVMPAIDQAVADGIVDPDRLAVMGQSNGGYSTLSLVVQSDRFKAAVMNAGFGDLTGFYGAMVGGMPAWIPWLEANGGAMGVPPWEAPQRYVDNSPIYQLHRLNTPLIVQAGSADPAIVPFSDQVWVGLQRLGKQATYLRYGGEGHVLAAAANLRDYWTRVLAFFGEHLADDATQ